MDSPYGYSEYDAERLRDSGSSDRRSPFARDHDRLLYTRAFRRLQGKTQVVTPGEADFFRTRLTHTLEVAQVARRLTERLNKTALGLLEQGRLNEWDGRLEKWMAPAGLVDPDVCEAAAVLHDLGHAPFGHAGERALAEAIPKVTAAGSGWEIENSGSFDGNAQSFRLACHAITHKTRGNGLELTRAVLDGSLKYPRGWEPGVKKWSVFPTEMEDFRGFVRDGVPDDLLDEQTVEAQIMDWADDIAYSVHDVDDWFHAGFMPIAGLVSSEEQLSDLSGRIIGRWLKRDKIAESDKDVVDGAIRNLFQSRDGPFGHFVVARGAGHPITDPTSWEAREAIRHARSVLFDEFQGATRLAVRVDDPSLSRRYALAAEIDSNTRRRCDILRELLWIYVVGSPGMATHQAGQKRVVTELLTRFAAAAKSDEEDALDIFPLDVRDDLRGADSDLKRLRLIVDFVSGMTDAYALRLHARITGGETRFLEYV